MYKYFFVFLFLKIFSHQTQAENNFPDSVLIVKNISVSGNKITKPFVIFKEMYLKKDSILTLAKLEFDKIRIYNTQLFNFVDIKVEQDSIFANLEVVVTERFYFMAFPVFGFRDKEISRFYYGAGFMKKNIDGEDKSIRIRAAAGYEPFIDFEFKNPYYNIQKDISFSVNLISNIFLNKSLETLGENEKNYYERWNSVSFLIGKRENIFNKYILQGGFSNVFVKNLKSGRSVNENGTDNYFWGRITKRFDSRDLIEFATSGYHYRAEIAKFGFPTQSVDIIKFIFDGKYFYPIKKKSTIGFRTYGSLAQGGKIPHYQKEYFGFETRLRGHYREIIEGENLVLISSEFRTPIAGPKYFHFEKIPFEQFKDVRAAIYGTIFADFGSAWDRNENFYENKKSGYGFGINFLAFYGLVLRTEVAFNAEEKPTPEFILGIGASF